MDIQRFGRKYVPWKDIEPNIEPLLRAINIRYETDKSCEGHPYEQGRFPYPWILLGWDQELGGLKSCLSEYSSKSKIAWVLQPMWVIGKLLPKLMPGCAVELSEYHEYMLNEWKLKQIKEHIGSSDAVVFADMIQEAYTSLLEEQKRVADTEEFKRQKKLADTSPSLEILQLDAKKLARYLDGAWS